MDRFPCAFDNRVYIFLPLHISLAVSCALYSELLFTFASLTLTKGIRCAIQILKARLVFVNQFDMLLSTSGFMFLKLWSADYQMVRSISESI